MDNRIIFPPTEIDFSGNLTGQDHDTFPAPGQQPRFDWMRSAIQGILSHQSSKDPPTQFRTGTIWYNLTKKAFYIHNGSSWVSLSEAIAVIESSDGSIVSLADWFIAAQDKLDSIQPRFTFSGYSTVDNKTKIPVPADVQLLLNDIAEFLHPVVYINGAMVDPRNSRFNSVSCPTIIELLNGINIDEDQRFTVVIERFDFMSTSDVVLS